MKPPKPEKQRVTTQHIGESTTTVEAAETGKATRDDAAGGGEHHDREAAETGKATRDDAAGGGEHDDGRPAENLSSNT